MSDKEYQNTHPWLTFNLNLSALPPSFWFDLGECVSKCDHLQRTAMSRDLRGKIHRLYLAKGAAATTAIEGNTLGEEGVKRRLEENEKLPESHAYLGAEVDNVVALFREFAEQAQDSDLPPLLPALLHKINGDVLRGLDVDGAIGRIRQRMVGVGNYRGAPHQDCAHLLEYLCTWLRDGEEFRQVKAERGKKAAGILRAVLAHLYIAWIHPYDDGNGRTARMAEFFLLISAGVPLPAAHLISNHCNTVRPVYYRELANSSKKISPVAFLCFIVSGLRDGLRKQLQWVYEEHGQLMWAEYAAESITGYAKTRERRIALAKLLAKEKAEMSIEEMIGNDAIFRLYADKAGRIQALQDDLSALITIKLVEQKDDGYRARLEVLRGLEPPTTDAGG